MSPKPLAEVDIPAENITPETVSNGMIIRLHPNEVLWKTSTNSIDLNIMTGKVFMEIKPKSLSETEINQVYNGLKTGRLISVKKIEKIEVPNIEMNFDPSASTARKILDLPDSEFESTILKFKRIHILELALALETQDKKRRPRMDFIQKQIALVSNK